jgi:hypothetical protein
VRGELHIDVPPTATLLSPQALSELKTGKTSTKLEIERIAPSGFQFGIFQLTVH